MKLRGFRYFTLAFVCSVATTSAQSPDLDQLNSKMRQIEQMMRELRQQIAAVEQGQKTPASAGSNAVPRNLI